MDFSSGFSVKTSASKTGENGIKATGEHTQLPGLKGSSAHHSCQGQRQKNHAHTRRSRLTQGKASSTTYGKHTGKYHLTGFQTNLFFHNFFSINMEKKKLLLIENLCFGK